MRYTIRHFDLPLLTFEANMDSADTDLHIIKVYEENRSFLPLNLTVSEDGVERWLRHRTIPKNRAYVDALLSKVGLSLNRPLGIIAANKGLSLNDCFWVDAEGSGDTFEKVNLYDNRFSQVLAAIAFTGYGSSIRTSLASCPEFSTNGMLPKCWRRQNGKIYLYKGGTSGFSNLGWIKEHPLDFDWTDEMEEANQQVQYQIYANKMLSYLKKNASAKEQFDTAVRFAIQYDVVDENNNVVTSYEPKIKFTMSLLANLELKIIFGTVPDALECHSYEEAVEHRNQFYEIVKKYSLGEVTGNQCVLNKMYDDMFAQKGSYAFYIQWLNNEFPSEVEYQKKLQETKGLKKILVMATKPNHLATIE